MIKNFSQLLCACIRWYENGKPNLRSAAPLAVESGRNTIRVKLLLLVVVGAIVHTIPVCRIGDALRMKSPPRKKQSRRQSEQTSSMHQPRTKFWGLENPLYMFLVIIYVVYAIMSFTYRRSRRRRHTFRFRFPTILKNIPFL